MAVVLKGIDPTIPEICDAIEACYDLERYIELRTKLQMAPAASAPIRLSTR